jgi:uncharacterized protein (TIGR00255 family)
MSVTGMTGFGRAQGEGHGHGWVIEARSVNGRTLEVRLRAPGGFEGLDGEARKLAQSRFQRGQLQISVSLRRQEGAADVSINADVMARYLQLADELVARGAAAPSADGILALRGVIESGEGEADADTRAALHGAMLATLEAALDELKRARDDEGLRLAPVLAGVLERIEALVDEAEKQAAAQTEAVRERFTRRVEELLPDAEDYRERVFAESAILAARADVREELDRLRVHVASARDLLGQAGTGRKLDFLMQEFMREANTLCSKSATSALTAVGLDLKAAIEQMREQVQNVE